RRTSSRNRSPKAMAATPSDKARSQALLIAASYSALEQGQGSGTVQSGRPAASACASRTSLRVPCMATRLKAALMVVSSPAISYSPDCLRTCNAHALSLPLLQEMRIFFTASSTLDRDQPANHPHLQSRPRYAPDHR